MACGTQKFTTAVLGGAVLIAIFLYAWLTAFGRRHHYDFILNLHWARPATELAALRDLLERHSRKARCAQQRLAPSGVGADLSYHLLLRDPDRADELLLELNALPGATDVNGVRADSESEKLPFIVFALGVLGVAFLWNQSASAPTLVAEAEIVRTEVRAVQPGTLVSLDVA
eukprot:gene44447-biopygen30511